MSLENPNGLDEAPSCSPCERRGRHPDRAAGEASRPIAHGDPRRARRVLFRSGVAATTLDAVAREVGVSKTALYYYFPSKDALLFELVFGAIETQAQAVHDAVEKTEHGGEALRAVVSETVNSFAPRLDDFRLAFLHGQVAGPGAVHWDERQFARIRPFNDLCFAGAARKLAKETGKRPGRAQVEPA